MSRPVDDADDGTESSDNGSGFSFGGLADGLASRRGFLSATALAGAGFAGVSGSSQFTLAEDTDSESESERDASTDFATVNFENQATDGKSVTVDSVVLSEGGFVAIHDTRLLDGQAVESVIGITDYLTPGEHRNVPARLFDVDGGDFDGQEELEETQSLIAMPHRDTDGDEEYDFVENNGGNDGPYFRIDQRPVIDIGFAVVDQEDMTSSRPATEFATVNFKNQETNGEFVEVDQVVLSEGGFVAIHDTRLLDGQAAASVIGITDYLTPGEHQNVRAELFDVDGGDFDGQEELEETQPLIAMPHRDTDGDEEYDFVETGGEEDGPYFRVGQPTIDIGFAVVAEAEERAAREFVADLSAEQSTVTDESDASASARFTLGDDRLSYRLSLRNIEDVTAGHIHRGERGETGPIVATLLEFTDETNGSGDGEPLSSVEDQPFVFSGEITADDLLNPLDDEPLSELVEIIRDEEAYVNIHTVENPSGEIRGQIVDTDETDD